MRVLGVDPGTIRTGWGLVERRGSRLTGIDAGVICAGSGEPLERRLHTIHAGLSAVVERLCPDAFAVESIFHARNANAALKLGHARGVALLVAATANLSVSDYAPAMVKRTVAGSGRAGKDQLGRLVGAILGLSELPPTDATDALAVAITHARACSILAAAAR